jgi:hypothetical protein
MATELCRCVGRQTEAGRYLGSQCFDLVLFLSRLSDGFTCQECYPSFLTTFAMNRFHLYMLVD